MQRYILKSYTRGKHLTPTARFVHHDAQPYVLVLAPDKDGAYGTAVMVESMPGDHSSFASLFNAPHAILLHFLKASHGKTTFIDIYPHEKDAHIAEVELWCGNMHARIKDVRFTYELTRTPTHGMEFVEYDPDIELQILSTFIRNITMSNAEDYDYLTEAPDSELTASEKFHVEYRS